MHWCSCVVAWLLAVLWEIRCSEETSDGFHCGADVSLLSQFPTEKEMLFPPLTMLQVQRQPGRKRTQFVPEDVSELTPQERSAFVAVIDAYPSDGVVSIVEWKRFCKASQGRSLYGYVKALAANDRSDTGASH